MGDADQRGAALLEVLGEPVDALDVEVVGGLVQDDQVGRAEQQLGEGDPAALATGERADDGVEAVGEAGEVEAAEEAFDDVADAGVAEPLVVGPVGDHLVPDGGVRVERVVLGEDGRLQVAAPGDPAAVGVLQLGEHPDQGGLAVAVASDDSDPVAFADAEADRVQQGAGAVDLRDGLDGGEVDGHVCCAPGIGGRGGGRPPLSRGHPDLPSLMGPRRQPHRATTTASPRSWERYHRREHHTATDSTTPPRAAAPPTPRPRPPPPART